LGAGLSAVAGPSSVYAKFEIIALNGCAARSSTDACLRAHCEMNKRASCPSATAPPAGTKPDDFRRELETLLQATAAELGERLKVDHCGVEELRAELVKAPTEPSRCWDRAVAQLRPYDRDSDFTVKEFAALDPMALSREIHYHFANNPAQFVAEFYCYAVARGYININNLSPPWFAFGIRGLPLAKTGVTAYARWLRGAKGQTCAARVKDSVGLAPDPARLGAILGDRPYAAVVNFNALLGQGGGNLFDANLKRVLNETRLRVAVDRLPGARARARKLWQKLPAVEQVAFRQRRARDEDLAVPDTLVEIYFAETFAATPAAGEAALK
jgi:hypothetical protein